MTIVKVFRTMNRGENTYHYWINEDFIKEAEKITYDKRENIFKEVDTLLIDKNSSLYKEALASSMEHAEYMKGVHSSQIPKEKPTEVMTMRVLEYQGDTPAPP